MHARLLDDDTASRRSHASSHADIASGARTHVLGLKCHEQTEASQESQEASCSHITIYIETLLELRKKGGGIFGLHLIDAQLLLQVQHKAPQESHKVLSPPDVAWHLPARPLQKLAATCENFFCMRTSSKYCTVFLHTAAGYSHTRMAMQTCADRCMFIHQEYAILT